jgi:ABC-type nickel/cobalt efflux system permease component RcnA
VNRLTIKDYKLSLSTYQPTFLPDLPIFLLIYQSIRPYFLVWRLEERYCPPSLSHSHTDLAPGKQVHDAAGQKPALLSLSLSLSLSLTHTHTHTRTHAHARTHAHTQIRRLEDKYATLRDKNLRLQALCADLEAALS